MSTHLSATVMPGLVPGIHVFLMDFETKTWMAGTSPAMTNALMGQCALMKAVPC